MTFHFCIALQTKRLSMCFTLQGIRELKSQAFEERMGSEIKSTLPLKFKLPKLESLIALSPKLSNISEKDFLGSYGKILRLLTMDVNMRALLSLAQFYDPSLYCFTFQDF